MNGRAAHGDAATAPAISLSVVSHGQGRLVAALLGDLAQPDWHGDYTFEVILTINIAEPENWLPDPVPFPMTIVRNDTARGFGTNHNAAFKIARGAYFAVVNPDIRLEDFRITELIAALSKSDVGACGPLVLAPDGTIEDSARHFPTLPGLLRRRLRGRGGPEYPSTAKTIAVDWLAGMFLLFRSDVFRSIGGFDERFFMYLEDIEIARVLRHRGLGVRWVGTTAVIHDAARASRRSARHLRYHLASAVRYFWAQERT